MEIHTKENLSARRPNPAHYRGPAEQLDPNRRLPSKTGTVETPARRPCSDGPTIRLGHGATSDHITRHPSFSGDPRIPAGWCVHGRPKACFLAGGSIRAQREPERSEGCVPVPDVCPEPASNLVHDDHPGPRMTRTGHDAAWALLREMLGIHNSRADSFRRSSFAQRTPPSSLPILTIEP